MRLKRMKSELNGLRAKLAEKGLTVVGARPGPTVICKDCGGVMLRAGPMTIYEHCARCKAAATASAPAGPADGPPTPAA